MKYFLIGYDNYGTNAVQDCIIKVNEMVSDGELSESQPRRHSGTLRQIICVIRLLNVTVFGRQLKTFLFAQYWVQH